MDSFSHEILTLVLTATLAIRAGKIIDELFDEDEIQVFNSNPNSPLYSAKTFEELNLRPELIKGKDVFPISVFFFFF